MDMKWQRIRGIDRVDGNSPWYWPPLAHVSRLVESHIFHHVWGPTQNRVGDESLNMARDEIAMLLGIDN